MIDPLRRIMLRFDPSWDKLSPIRKLERYGIVILYLILAALFTIIILTN